MKLIKTVAAAALLAVAATASSAATIDLSYGGDASGDGQTYGSFSSGGVTGTIVAGCDLGNYGTSRWDHDCNAYGQRPIIEIGSSGMGVDSPSDRGDLLDERNSGEFLAFIFDSAVDLLNIDFASFSHRYDAFDLYVNGYRVANNARSDPWTTDYYNVRSFYVVAEDGRFSIADFEANLAAVPLPASALLLLAGVGGLGAMRRRKG